MTCHRLTGPRWTSTTESMPRVLALAVSAPQLARTPKASSRRRLMARSSVPQLVRTITTNPSQLALSRQRPRPATPCREANLSAQSHRIDPIVLILFPERMNRHIIRALQVLCLRFLLEVNCIRRILHRATFPTSSARTRRLTDWRFRRFRAPHGHLLHVLMGCLLRCFTSERIVKTRMALLFLAALRFQGA